MGSDSLQKPDQQRSLVERFQLYRKKSFVYALPDAPRSWLPWILLPDLILGVLALIWTPACAITGLALRSILERPLILLWTYVAPSSFKSYLERLNWAHIGFKVFSRALLVFYAWIAIGTWFASPWGPQGRWPNSPVQDGYIVNRNLKDYFSDFTGAAICNVKAADLYAQPVLMDRGYGYCANRADLLKALSEGGRHGFQAPYVPQGCQYRWFSVEEICAILERFDGLVFVGDDNLEMIYAGFNILLRKDLQFGGLIRADSQDNLGSCACNSQFVDPVCHRYFVRSSKLVTSVHGEAEYGSYLCQRMPHAMLRIDQPLASLETISKFTEIVRPAPPSNYKPIPIIHSLTSEASIEAATISISQFITLAEESKRNVPMLWIGPTAAGYIEVKGRKGNQEIWRFTTEMAKVAKEKDIEALGLWNLTVQAESYDGKHFGENVSIVTAMMVINWLARLESS